MFGSLFLLFFLFALGAPLVLYFLVENEGRERVTDRASAETWARRDRDDRPPAPGAGSDEDGGRDGDAWGHDDSRRRDDSSGWGRDGDDDTGWNRDDDDGDDDTGWNR